MACILDRCVMELIELRSRAHHWRLAIGAGSLAAVYTVYLFLSASRSPAHFAALNDLFAIGPILVLIPFGGLHEARVPEGIAIALGALANGVLWGALTAVGTAFVRAGLRS